MPHAQTVPSAATAYVTYPDAGDAEITLGSPGTCTGVLAFAAEARRADLRATTPVITRVVIDGTSRNRWNLPNRVDNVTRTAHRPCRRPD